MPLVGIEVAGGEEVDARALSNGDVGDDEARVVGGHIGVEVVGEDPVVSVEEDDDKEGECGGSGELDHGPDLVTLASFSWPWPGNLCRVLTMRRVMVGGGQSGSPLYGQLQDRVRRQQQQRCDNGVGGQVGMMLEAAQRASSTGGF